MKARALAGLLCLFFACSLVALAVDWQTYTSPDGAYSIQGPGPPGVTVRTQKTPLGDVQVTTSLWKAPGVEYAAAFNDLPGLATMLGPTPIWVEMRNGFVSRLGGAVSNEQDFQFQGNPGRMLDFTIPAQGDMGPRSGHAQAVLFGSWLYVLTATWDAPLIPPDRGVAFFSTFHVTR